MKNIQLIDRADDATFSLFQATSMEFDALFPEGREMVLIEDVVARLGEEATADLLSRIRERPVLKRHALGIDGTIFFGWADRRHHIPPTGREVDWPESALDPAQRRLFAARRAAETGRAGAEEDEPNTAGHGCLVTMVGAIGLWQILSGGALLPIVSLLWGAVLLGPLAVRKPSSWLGRPVDRRDEPSRYWALAIAGGSLIGFGLYTLLSGG